MEKGKSLISGSGLTLTSNEINHIVIVIRFLEIDEFYSNKPQKKLLVKKEDFLFFVFVTLGLKAAASATDATIQKTFFGSAMHPSD